MNALGHCRNHFLFPAIAFVFASVQYVLGQEKPAEEPISAIQITTDYAENPAAFNIKYKGKTITVEGIVNYSFVDAGKTKVMMLGYTKPGQMAPYGVRCEESSSDFEGIRGGHRVRIRGTFQAHDPGFIAAVLTDCKVVKVFADDYPPSKQVRDDAKKLQGTWKITSAETGGRKLKLEESGFDHVIFKGYSANLQQGTKLYSFGLSLDSGKTPKSLDLVGAKATLPCIWSLEGENLRLVLPGRANNGAITRPAEFDTTKTNGMLLSAERQK